VPDNRIIEFVIGGPKNYTYKISKPDKDGNTTICKVRGITLNYKNSLLQSVRSRAVVLHDDSFVEDYPVVFVLMYGK
jgi:hypothetical protein